MLSAGLAIGTQAVAQSPLNIGRGKQLFIDHKFISTAQNINLTVNPPEKLPGPILESDKPWDAFRLIWYSVAKDQDGFKMWYQAYDALQWSGGTSRMCYATSNDGIHWEKPSLGLVSYNGSTDNNILMESSVERSVFIDPHALPEQRYKMVGQYPDVQMGTSPDGIHWTQHSEVVWNTPWDTQKTAFWDESKGKYVISVRSQISADTTNPNDLPYPFVAPIASNPSVVAPQLYRSIRQLSQIEVDDIMQPWPVADARTVMAADELDPADSDIYHPGGVYKYPYADDAYFSFPWLYQHWPDSPIANDGEINVQLAASRNGANWMRYDRQPYIDRGEPGEPDCGMVMSNVSFFREGDYLYQYYTGWPWSHGGFKALTPEQQADPANWGKGYYGVVKQRLDGFVSADVGAEGGRLETPTIVFEGDRLILNIDASAAGGSALVGILDADGNPIPGFGIADCDVIQVNDVDYMVTWEGRCDLSALAGTPIELVFEMQSTKLYAFQFQQLPEPGTIAMLASGAAAFLLGMWQRRRKRRSGIAWEPQSPLP